MSVFTLERREEVQEKLLEVGIELIKEKGIRKMTISEVTAKAGIGKGTFYHFYEAKEFYVWDVIRYSKNELKETVNEAVKKNGGLDRKTLKEIVERFSFCSRANIISFITMEDEQWLKEKLPEGYLLDIPRESEIITAFLNACKNKKKNVNGQVAANMMKIMALAAENKDILYENALKENLEIMVDTLCDYIFEKD